MWPRKQQERFYYEYLFAEKLKKLRAEKKVSQEKLAQYLDVSSQAVSKWETGNAYPDITLLPDLARFFGVTVDELLCVEKIDEKRLFDEYSEKAADLFRSGNTAGALALWQQAYRSMPNNIDVKEMLMSSYFDTDRKKYFNEFYDLAIDICNENAEEKHGQGITKVRRFHNSLVFLRNVEKRRRRKNGQESRSRFSILRKSSLR